VTSVIVATIPLFSPLVAFLFLKEKVNRATLFGIAISLLGVLAVIFSGNADISGQATGALLVFGAVIAALGYAVFVKYLMNRYNATTLVFYQNLIGLLYFIPCFFAVDWAHLDRIQPTVEAIASLVQLSVFASVVAFICYSRGVKVLGVARAGVFGYLISVFTALAAFFMVDERLTVWQWLGMVVVILGLFVSKIKSNT
jgi:drug/metabolite transporter (DMT)-like permease